jgi:hypothetical protein
MSLTNLEIITEADILVPNAYTTANKIPWLNALNQEFFDIVKIPQSEQFTTVSGTKIYTLTSNEIKEKNIDKVMAGALQYRSLNYEEAPPVQNWYTYNDTTKQIALSAAPSRSGIVGIVRYRKSSTTTFTVASVASQTPDAPSEYHWIIVLGLAEYIAKANEEDEKAQDYGGQYRNALNVAAQNYQRGDN